MKLDLDLDLDRVEIVLWSVFFFYNVIFYAIGEQNYERLILALISVVMVKLITIEIKLRGGGAG